jgi:hypothetical protein
MDSLLNYINENSVLLFQHAKDDPCQVCFDTRGFFLSEKATSLYLSLRDTPHLYVAYTNTDSPSAYIGKSYQKGGRWKRSHAYHLGTLAYHLLNCTRYDDQNHQHWIYEWMNIDSLKESQNLHWISLKSQIFISFIPFTVYSPTGYDNLEKKEIRKINTKWEAVLMHLFQKKAFKLLNVQQPSLKQYIL